MTNPTESIPRVTAECIIHARSAVVYSALTEGKLIQRWWSAWTNCKITKASFEAKRGGLYSIETETREGGRHYIRGEVLHIDPTLIAITWVTELSTGFDSTVFISIEACGEDQTRVKVDHRGLQSDSEGKRMHGGWPHILQVMQRGIARIDESHEAAEVAAFQKERHGQH